MFEKILLAVDDSKQSIEAAQEAGELARAMKSKILRIVISFDPIPTYLGEPNLQIAINARLLRRQEILKRAQKAVGKIPGEIHTEFIEGSPADVIINVAKTRGSSVIVMGSRGVTNLAGLLLGSICHNVISQAPCPVLIVR